MGILLLLASEVEENGQAFGVGALKAPYLGSSGY
jgi:hypothetical protein